MSKTLGIMFFKTSIIFFFVGCIWGAIQTLPPVHEFTEEGPGKIIVGMHAHWNLLGWVSLAIMGAIYYLVPMMVGKELYSEKLGKIHFWLFVIFTVIMTILGVMAGYQGGILYMAKNFTAIDSTIGPLMMGVSIFGILEAAVNILFVYNIFKTMQKSR